MPIAVIGNALTINCVFLDQIFCCLFAPFEAGIYLWELPVPGTSVSSVQLYPYPERLCVLYDIHTRIRTFYIRSVCTVYTNHTRVIYPGYCPTKSFCNFCKTLIPVAGTSRSSVRRRQKDPGYGYSMFTLVRNFWNFCTPVPQYPQDLEVLNDFNTRTWSVCEFCKICATIPGISRSFVRLLFPYLECL